jgi:hypothetical protein
MYWYKTKKGYIAGKYTQIIVYIPNPKEKI